jgi:hypothetical protein
VSLNDIPLSTFPPTTNHQHKQQNNYHHNDHRTTDLSTTPSSLSTPRRQAIKGSTRVQRVAGTHYTTGPLQLLSVSFPYSVTNNMSWWDGGDDSSGGNKSKETSFTSDDTSSFLTGSNIMATSGSGGDSGMQELQQMSLHIQQQMIVQQIISDLSDSAYTQCITSKPSDSLTGTQVACIKSTVNKWMDTNDLMTGRLAKKSQAPASY